MISMSNYTDHTTVSQIRYTQPNLSDDGIVYTPRGLWAPKIDAKNIAYHSLFAPFDLEQYLYPRPPIDMGLIDADVALNGTVNVLRMPLKFPGTNYRIPREMIRVMPILERVAEYESFINSEHESCFCHITFDVSNVSAGEYHRYPGFHGDGIQGTKLTPKVKVEHREHTITKVSGGL